MAYAVPDNSEVYMLEYIFNKTAPQELDIRLYTNNHPPTETDTAANYTEAAGGGYVTKQLSSASWTVVAGNPSLGTHTQISWLFTGAVGNVYGYYVTRRLTGELMWAESFNNGPYNIQNNGDEIRVTPRFSLQ